VFRSNISSLLKSFPSTFFWQIIHSIQDLAESNLFCRAEAIVEASKYEHILTDPERKVKLELHKLE